MLRNLFHPVRSTKREQRDVDGDAEQQPNSLIADRLNAIDARLERLDYWGFRQLEATVALYSTLGIGVPLPPMRLGATSPDFLAELVRVIARKKPRLVLELGGGVSTIVTSYALERVGAGAVVTLEHNADWVKRVSGYLAEHRLSHRSNVIHSPLIPIELDGRVYHWYDLAAFTIEPRSVDLLVIDGPPAWGSHDPMSRYPALPMLADLLADDAAIIQDDADREGEAAALRMWNAAYGPLEVERPVAEKGMTVTDWSSRRCLRL